MTDQPTPQSDGPITREQAVELLMEPEAEAAPAAPVEVAAEEPEAEPEEQPAEAQPADGDDTPAEEPVEAAEEDESEPAQPAIAPPKSWDAEARVEFALLPPALQKTVAAREEERERALSRVQMEAADARKKADAEASILSEYKAQHDQLIPQARTTFADKWANVDWVEWSRQDPAAAQLGRFQYEDEQRELARLQAVHQETEGLSFKAFLEAENERLKEVAPDLADPKEGPAKRKAVAEYLVTSGIQPEQIRHVSAVELAIAQKAMLWDAAQAKAKTAAAAPKPKSAPVRTVAPVAAAASSTTQQRETQRITNRFAQTGGREDAVALILAKGL